MKKFVYSVNDYCIFFKFIQLSISLIFNLSYYLSITEVAYFEYSISIKILDYSIKSKSEDCEFLTISFSLKT